MGTIIQREDMKLFFQKFRISIPLIKERENKDHTFFVFMAYFNTGNFATHEAIKRLKTTP